MKTNLEIEVFFLLEKNRVIHRHINEITTRLKLVEKLLGTPTESFNDLSCKVGDISRRLAKLEDKK